MAGRFQDCSSKTSATFQQGCSKAQFPGFPEHAFCWHHSPPKRLKPKRIAVGKLQQGSQEGYGRVAARLQEGSSKVPARFQQGSRKVQARFQQGSSKVPGRFKQGSSKAEGRFQQGSSKVPARFQQGSRKVQARFQQGSSKVPRKVPARFQEGSSKVALNSCKHVCRSPLLFNVLDVSIYVLIQYKNSLIKRVRCINIFHNTIQ